MALSKKVLHSFKKSFGNYFKCETKLLGSENIMDKGGAHMKMRTKAYDHYEQSETSN